MARVFRRRRRVHGKLRRGKKYTVAFRDHTGIERSFPTGTDQGAAKDVGRMLDRLVSYRAAKLRPDPDLLRWIEGLRPSILGKLKQWDVLSADVAGAGKPLAAHLADYEAALLAKGNTTQHAKRTHARAKSVVDACDFEWWGDLNGARVMSRLADMRQDKVDADGKVVAGIGAQTSNHYLGALKSFCRWMVLERRAAENPLTHLRMMNAKAERRRVRRELSIEERRRLIAAAESSNVIIYGMAGRDRAALYRLTLSTGLRWNELRSLSVSSFDLDADTPTVTVEAGYSKHRHEDVQPIPMNIVDALRDYLRDRTDGRAFPMPVSDQGSKIVRFDLWNARKTYWREVRGDRSELRQRIRSGLLAREDAQGRVVDFHALRHSFVSALAQGGVHPKTAQMLARHSTITLTMDRYTHISSASQVQALDALPDLDAVETEDLAATGTDGEDGGPTVDRKVDRRPVQSGRLRSASVRTQGQAKAKLRPRKTPENTEERCVSGPSKTGGPSRTRTCDQGIMSPLL